MIDRICPECSKAFATDDPKIKICSDECRLERQRRRGREHAAKKYVKRIYPKRECPYCGSMFIPKKSNAQICSDLCRSRKRADSISKLRQSARQCIRCGTKENLQKVGKPVCLDCRIDKRDPEKSKRKELLRKFSKYGLTENEFETMLQNQNHRCAICLTDDPKTKGWCIDHCHTTKIVRGILCSNCNSAIGLMKENTFALRAAIEYLCRANMLSDT